MRKGLFVRNYTTVVMDGSNNDYINAITGIIDMMTGERYGKATCRTLDSNHPTTKVIEVCTGRKRFNQIQDVIEQVYPGLCVFNPAL